MLFTFLLVVQVSLHSQISYGGKPYFPQSVELRFSANPAFFQMPPFDLDSLLEDDQLNESSMRGSYRFAHKFYTNIEKSRDAQLVVLPDGTRVWTLTIQSEGAYSLNFLLEDVIFPQGGQLFVYNKDYSHVIGKFDHRNISDSRILPIQPVSGETVILEYSEPTNAEFEGNFVITEVNHDYRDFLRKEPGTDTSSFGCMPDALCEDVDTDLIRSTVLLIIDGTTSCSGTLINNAEESEDSYVLTAAHCLSSDISTTKSLEYYVGKASTVIAFFNYNRTICGTTMKGTEEMSIAGSYPQVIMEKRDIALLEFRDRPPRYFNVYYAGWSLSLDGTGYPFFNLHHPQGAVKKYGEYDKRLDLASYPGGLFDRNVHWKVQPWTIGATDGGSSGSPLFDKNGLIVGGLSGGRSDCLGSVSDSGEDYFFSLAKAWKITNKMGQLETFLDPENKITDYCLGYDPNKHAPITRLGNIDFRSGDGAQTSVLTAPASGYVFGGNNSQGAKEFAEAFYVEKEVELLGAYLLVPPMAYSRFTDGITISVYTGSNFPEDSITSYDFHPQYLNYSGGNFYLANKSTSSVGTENFIRFSPKEGKELKVKGKFFISYQIRSVSNPFCVYNTEFETPATNSAWIKYPDGTWTEASNYPNFEKAASLSILTLVADSEYSAIEFPEKEKADFPLYYDRTASVLRVKTPVTYSGNLRIHSITGQLIEECKLLPGKDQYLVKPMKKGSIGVVRIIANGKCFSMKFIY